MLKETQIAVLMTCYNRKEVTLACLDALSRQEKVDGVKRDIYLVDDGCTDGTGEAVQDRYPAVKVIRGNGSLFWCGGMRVSWAKAFRGNYDYYLWLNDDTVLFPRGLRILLDTSQMLQNQIGGPVIVSGSTCDPSTRKVNYGGVIQKSRWQSMRFLTVEPSLRPLQCDTIHGNCVLIPREVAQQVGNFSRDFTHYMGDFDYGLRARKLGISCWISPGYIGTCKEHDLRAPFFDPKLSLNERIAMMHSPAGGLPPAREWMRFTRRHAGVLWPKAWLRLWLRLCLPWLWLLVRNKRRV